MHGARPIQTSRSIAGPFIAADVKSGSDILLLAGLAALFGYAVVLFAPQVLNDGDTYTHIAAGLWILGHRAVPGTDPFSYTFAGAPWVAHEWLSELLMGIAYRVGGWSGLVILFGAATALAFGLLARHLGYWLGLWPGALALIVAICCISPSLLARPHMLALPVMIAWTAGLLIARERERVPWRLLPLMVLWANLHGGFVFGVALVCPLALEAVLAGPVQRRARLLEWGGFLAASIAAAALTPHGAGGLLFPFKLLSLTQLDAIDEWRPPDFHTLQPIEIALLIGLYVCLSRGVRVPMFRLLVLLGLLHLAFAHSRHQLLAGAVGALFLAGPVGASLDLIPPKIAASRALLWPLVVIACLLTLLRVSVPLERRDGLSSPISALAHVPPSLAATPVFNDYAFGGYLIFRGLHPFIDARAEVFGDPFLKAYRQMTQPDPARLTETLDRFAVQWTILAKASPAIRAMDAMPGWHRVYGDDFAVVHARDTAFTP